MTSSAKPQPAPVLAHGDFHGFNQVWSQTAWTLRLVADFETTGPADPEFDFRYLPPLKSSFRLVTETHQQYVAHGGRSLNLQRVMAWHIRTALGDALWRSEAGIPLPRLLHRRHRSKASVRAGVRVNTARVD